MGFYGMLDPEERKEFGHFLFKVLPTISMEQKVSRVT